LNGEQRSTVRSFVNLAIIAAAFRIFSIELIDGGRGGEQVAPSNIILLMTVRISTCFDGYERRVTPPRPRLWLQTGAFASG
jgi:hypothetical protein